MHQNAEKLDHPLLLRRLRLLTAVAVTIFSIGTFGLASSANAETTQNFCAGAWLDKYGLPGDNCSGYYGFQNWVEVEAHEHSACVSATTNSQKSGVYLSWKCTAGPWSSAKRWAWNEVFSAGIIRNNTTGSTNHATGRQSYCDTQYCKYG